MFIRRAEYEELLLERDRFELAFESSHVGMALVDISLRFVKVNDSCERVMERVRADLIGRSLQEFTAPESLDEDLEMIRQCLIGDRDRYRIRKAFVMPDGRLKWVQLSVVLVRRNGQPILFIKQFTDVDKEVVQEDDLRGELERERAKRIRCESELALLRGETKASLVHDWERLISEYKSGSKPSA